MLRRMGTTKITSLCLQKTVVQRPPTPPPPVIVAPPVPRRPKTIFKEIRKKRPSLHEKYCLVRSRKKYNLFPVTWTYGKGNRPTLKSTGRIAPSASSVPIEVENMEEVKDPRPESPKSPDVIPETPPGSPDLDEKEGSPNSVEDVQMSENDSEDDFKPSKDVSIPEKSFTVDGKTLIRPWQSKFPSEQCEDEFKLLDEKVQDQIREVDVARYFGPHRDVYDQINGKLKELYNQTDKKNCCMICPSLGLYIQNTKNAKFHNFFRKDGLDKHFLRFHVASLSCGQCKKKFRSTKKLLAHQEKMTQRKDPAHTE